jgi:hypothetical protein
MIWINEQIDPSGIIYSCIAYSNENSAKDCYEGWLQDLTQEQKNSGWIVRLRTVESWDDVPVNALKLSY